MAFNLDVIGLLGIDLRQLSPVLLPPGLTIRQELVRRM